jgi:hypothetical protein
VAWSLAVLSHAGQAEVIAKMNAGALKTDEDLVRYASAISTREKQPDLFAPEVPPERLEARRARRTAIQRAWDALAVVGEPLRIMGETAPVDLAEALGPDAALYAERFALLAKHATWARMNLSQAAAIYAAAHTAPAGDA